MTKFPDTVIVDDFAEHCDVIYAVYAGEHGILQAVFASLGDANHYADRRSDKVSDVCVVEVVL